MYINNKKGFTLIELLVVIAIIGILSSVVLASLNTARDKAKNASIQSNLDTVRVQAELYYSDTSNTYGTAATNDCSAGMFAASATISEAIGEAVSQSAAASCNSTTQAWAVSVPLVSAPIAEDNWCVDNTGKSGAQADPQASADVTCT